MAQALLQRGGLMLQYLYVVLLLQNVSAGSNFSSPWDKNHHLAEHFEKTLNPCSRHVYSKPWEGRLPAKSNCTEPCWAGLFVSRTPCAAWVWLIWMGKASVVQWPFNSNSATVIIQVSSVKPCFPKDGFSFLLKSKTQQWLLLLTCVCHASYLQRVLGADGQDLILKVAELAAPGSSLADPADEAGLMGAAHRAVTATWAQELSLQDRPRKYTRWLFNKFRKMHSDLISVFCF